MRDASRPRGGVEAAASEMWCQVREYASRVWFFFLRGHAVRQCIVVEIGERGFTLPMVCDIGVGAFAPPPAPGMGGSRVFFGGEWEIGSVKSVNLVEWKDGLR